MSQAINLLKTTIKRAKKGLAFESHFITRPCIPLVLALMAGLVAGFSLSPPFSPALTFSLVLLLLGLPFAILAFPYLSLGIGCCFFIVVGLSLTTFLSPRVTFPQVPALLVNQSVQHLSGVIIQEPMVYPDRTRLVISLSSHVDQGQDRPVQGTILLGVQGIIKGFEQGDPVRFVSRLRWIEGYHNPGGYDFEKRMADKGIRVSGFLADPALLVLTGPNLRAWPWQRLSFLRTRVSALIDARMSSPFNGLAQALLTGDQSKIPREIQEAFSRAGVSHLLAFSGLNLTLVGGLSFYLIRFLFGLSETLMLRINIRKWALIGTFFPVLGYTLLAGMSPSAARAFVMVSMVLMALLLNRYSDLLNTLALAALILLLFSPEALFRPSFQLSFIAVWAIGYLLPRLVAVDAQGEERKKSLVRQGLIYLWGSFGVSLVCQLATAPVVAWWFHQISFIGLLSNLILVPLTGILATPIGLSALLFAPFFPSLSAFLFWIMDLLLQGTLGLTRFFADLPLAYGIVPRPGYGEMVWYYLTLVFIFNWRKIPKPAWMVSFSLLGMAFFFFLPQIKGLFDPTFRATFLDVGHGSSIFLEFPGGQTMLIDGGGSINPDFDIGERVVAPFLWAKKITSLDKVVLTHPHPDHLNGLPFILSKFKVKEIWLNGQDGDSDAYRLLQELIRKKNTPVLIPERGRSCTISGVRVEVLVLSQEHPSPGRSHSRLWQRQNNASLVLRLSYNDQHLLLPSDIEAEAEGVLLTRGGPLPSQILQIPHHGSLTSSTVPFIDAVHPRFGIISGRGSARRNLPHPEIVKRYEERGVTLLRTDQEGAIGFEFHRKEWKVSGFKRGDLFRGKSPL